MKNNAKFWKPIGNNKVQCSLCHQSCSINNDQFGLCGVRRNENGKLYTLIYGSCSSVAADPIEKKPLYHFHPGSNALSLGTVGCNFKCLHCQNASISRATPDFPYMQEIKPDEVVELAKKRGCEGIAWTYNEPTIWHEFSFDSSKLAKKAGLYTVYVSNGYIQEEPFREISPFLDAINVDIKAFTDEFYKKHQQLFEQRIKNGKIRDCHGDLHMEHICLIDPIIIFDCIEFNDRFRYSDTVSDIAFLLMDLEFNGGENLSEQLCEAYLTHVGEKDDDLIYQLIKFYKIYRAYVR